jgi:hypothetical protein
MGDHPAGAPVIEPPESVRQETRRSPAVVPDGVGIVLVVAAVEVRRVLTDSRLIVPAGSGIPVTVIVRLAGADAPAALDAVRVAV